MGKPWSTILTIIIIITSWKAWPRSFLGTPTYSILTPWGFPQLFPRAAVPLVFPGAWPHTPWMKGAFHDLGEKVQPHGHVDYINILHMVCICIYILLYIDAQYLGINQFTWNMGMGEMIWFRFVLKKDFAPPVLAQMIPVRVVGVTSCRSSLGSCTCPNCPASQITSNSVLS